MSEYITSEYITFIALTVTFILIMAVAFYFVRSAFVKEKLHQALSNHFGLRGNYVNEKNFKLYGKHRNYKLTIEAVKVPISSAKANSIKLSVPMVNPTRKCLRISKHDPSHPDLENIVPLDKLLAVKHDMGDWMQINTNDLVFSSLVLGENARISIYESLKDLKTGAIMYIQDEELACVVPGLLKRNSQLEPLYKIVRALIDMKEELN